MLGLIQYQLVINLLQSSIRTIEGPQFPKIIVFKVGKKVIADRQVLMKFLDWVFTCVNCKCAWLCGLVKGKLRRDGYRLEIPKFEDYKELELVGNT